MTQTPPRFKGHRWFATNYDSMNRENERRIFAPLRPHIVGGASGEVLEIGAGTGANFPYYTHLAGRILATEPDPFMFEQAQKRAQELGKSIELFPYPAEALPFPDGSFDTVVCTLVLCTVREPVQAFTEMHRVLRPSGTLRFMEHVRADGLMGTVQSVITPLWQLFAGGCHPNRSTLATLQEARFVITELEEQRPMALLPLVSGVATRQ